MALDVPKRLKELKDFTHEQIQEEAAWVWASRACAALKYAVETQDYKEHLKWMIEYEDYKHEALEHAALIEKSSGLLTQMIKALDDFEQQILKS